MRGASRDCRDGRAVGHALVHDGGEALGEPAVEEPELGPVQQLDCDRVRVELVVGLPHERELHAGLDAGEHRLAVLPRSWC